MDVVAALALFSGLAAFVCAKARAAGPALLFGVVGLALFASTPLGAGVPHAVAAAVTAVGEVASALSHAIDTS